MRPYLKRLLQYAVMAIVGLFLVMQIWNMAINLLILIVLFFALGFMYWYRDDWRAGFWKAWSIVWWCVCTVFATMKRIVRNITTGRTTGWV